jgi:transposase
MRSYSLDLREKIAAAYDQKVGSQRELADLFGVGKATVERIIRRRRETGSLAPKPRAGGRTSQLDAAGLDRVRQLIARDNDLTLAELGERLEAELGVRLSVSRLCRIVAALGLPLKKSRSTTRSATASASGASAASTRRGAGSSRRGATSSSTSRV